MENIPITKSQNVRYAFIELNDTDAYTLMIGDCDPKHHSPGNAQVIGTEYPDRDTAADDAKAAGCTVIYNAF